MLLPQWNPLQRLRHASQRETELQAARYRITNIARQTTLADRALLADTPALRNKGLLGRNGLDAGEALWIVPCEAVHTIGMRFPIDLVYLDRKLRVRKVCSCVPAWRFSGCIAAYSVIELPAGVVRETLTEAGDTIEIVDAATLSPVT